MLDVKESVATGISDYYAPNTTEEVDMYLQAQQTIATKIFRQFVSDRRRLLVLCMHFTLRFEGVE